MKYAVEMSSGAMIYIPNFIKIGSAIQKVMGRVQRHRHTHTQNMEIS
jgi:Uri superfamily endonuclease